MGISGKEWSNLFTKSQWKLFIVFIFWTSSYHQEPSSYRRVDQLRYDHATQWERMNHNDLLSKSKFFEILNLVWREADIFAEDFNNECQN
jgi:hypothetical protein